MKFSIRDILLVTVIAALTAAWYVDRRQLLIDNARHKTQEEQYRKEALKAQAEYETLKKVYWAGFRKAKAPQPKPIVGRPKRVPSTEMLEAPLTVVRPSSPHRSPEPTP